MIRNQNNNFPKHNDKPNTNQTSSNSFMNFFHVDNSYADNITPFQKQVGTRKSFYSRVNTTPVKVKNDFEEGSLFYSQYETTVDKKINKENKNSDFNDTIKGFLTKFSENEKNDIFSPSINSLSTANTNRFTSNSNARNQVKNLISDKRENESKPALNMLESKNYMIAFSKTKKFDEEKEIQKQEIEKSKSVWKKSKEYKNEANEETLESNRENSYSDEIKEESGEDSFSKKIKKQIANLPIPIEKKDDENFKLLKMKEMKRKSMPPNKSAKAYDADLIPSHQREMIDEYNFSLCKKRKSVHSAKKIYKSVLPFTNPRNMKEVHRFPLYRDHEIGIYEYWQTHLIESKADEDLPTDDEQLLLAEHYTKCELREAFDIMIKEGASCLRNKGLLTFGDGSVCDT